MMKHAAQAQRGECGTQQPGESPRNPSQMNSPRAKLQATPTDNAQPQHKQHHPNPTKNADVDSAVEAAAVGVSSATAAVALETGPEGEHKRRQDRHVFRSGSMNASAKSAILTVGEMHREHSGSLGPANLRLEDGAATGEAGELPGVNGSVQLDGGSGGLEGSLRNVPEDEGEILVMLTTCNCTAFIIDQIVCS